MYSRATNKQTTIMYYCDYIAYLNTHCKNEKKKTLSNTSKHDNNIMIKIKRSKKQI